MLDQLELVETELLLLETDETLLVLIELLDELLLDRSSMERIARPLGNDGPGNWSDPV